MELVSSDFYFRIICVILKKFMNDLIALKEWVYYFSVMWIVENPLLIIKSSKSNVIKLYNYIIHLVNKCFIEKIFIEPILHTRLDLWL